MNEPLKEPLLAHADATKGGAHEPPPIPDEARRVRTPVVVKREEDRVDEAVDESFPASDPPAHAIERCA